MNLSEMNMSEKFAVKPYYGLQVYPRLKGFQYPVIHYVHKPVINNQISDNYYVIIILAIERRLW